MITDFYSYRRLLQRTFALFAGLGIAASSATAQSDQLTAYPSSAVTEAKGLDDERRQLMRSLVLLPAKDKEREKVREKLCTKQVKKPAPGEEGIKAALSVVESDMTIEVQFEKTGTGKATEAKSFSVQLEFTDNDLLIRPSLPRYASDGQGLLVPFPWNQTRFLWVEGKQGSDLLFLVPDVHECGVQSVVICPRTYVPRTTLATTGYAPNATRHLVTVKADGLFAVSPGETGRIQASMQATKGMELPHKWSHEDRSTTPSATIKFSSPRSITDKPPVFIPGTLPILGAIEARLDFGKEMPQRTVRNRVTTEVASFDLSEPQKTTIRGALLNVETGPCFMVSKWREQNL